MENGTATGSINLLGVVCIVMSYSSGFLRPTTIKRYNKKKQATLFLFSFLIVFDVVLESK